MFTNPQKEALDDWLKNQSFDTVADLVNDYLGGDDFIFASIEDVADIAPNDDPLWVARALFFGNVESWGDCVRFNGYGNLESVWRVDQLPLDQLADVIIDQEAWEFEAVALSASGSVLTTVIAVNEDQAVELIEDELGDDFDRVASIYWRLP